MPSLDALSPRALMNLKWLVKLWRHGSRTGAAFDLDVDEADGYEAHPDVLALRELQQYGYVTLDEAENLKIGWTLAADLTDAGVGLADDHNFDTTVPAERFPYPP